MSALLTVLGGPSYKPSNWKVEPGFSELKSNLASQGEVSMGYLMPCLKTTLKHTPYIQGIIYQFLTFYRSLPTSLSFWSEREQLEMIFLV